MRRRRLDVTDFATPVRLIDSFVQEGNAGGSGSNQRVIMIICTYQTDNQFTLAVEPLTEEQVEDRRKTNSRIQERSCL